MALLGSMRSGLVAVDRAGRIVAWNGDARRIFGRAGDAPDAWIGRDCRTALAAHPTVWRLLLEALDGRERPSRAELALAPGPSRPGGTIGFTLTPVRGATGDVVGAALVFRDLAPIERSDEQARLRERLAALGQMAAGLAHELRTPLAAVEVLASLLRRRLDARGNCAEEVALLAEITGELRSLAATVTESLDFVKPLALVPRHVDLSALLEEALGLALQRVPFEGDVERSVEAALPGVQGDADALRSLLVNLIVNAAEAMAASPPARRRLRLAARVERGAPIATWAVTADGGASVPAPPRALVVEVEDAGPGVPPELRERIFYPFFTTKQRGSGIGLALAQKVAASHGGSLELAEADGGAGACFRLRLPLADGARP